MGPGAARAVFLVHGVLTSAAAIVLALFPAAIPSTVGISIVSGEYLLSYFLAAAELGIGVLSLGAVRLRDPGAVRLIAVSFAVFHGATSIFELVHLVAEGVDATLIANIAVRVIATVAFLLVARGRRS